MFVLDPVARFTTQAMSTGHTFSTHRQLGINQDHTMYWVKACTPAKLVLSRQSGYQEDTDFIVTLGDRNNRWTVIEWGSPSRKTEESATPGVLSCHQSRPFWVRWSDGSYVAVGEGTVVGKDLLVRMTLEDTQTHPMTAVGFGLPSRGIHTWEVHHYRGTSNKYMYMYSQLYSVVILLEQLDL